MRKTSLLAFLMLTLLLGLNAKAQVAFVASTTPSNNEWDTETHWYNMTVDGKYVSLESTDDSGNLKLSVTDQPTDNEKAMWCLVGDNTTGYRFYNKNAGTAKVLGLTNIKHLDSDNSDTYGGSRAKMYDATTESSATDNTGIGTNFIYTQGNATNSYYFKLSNTNMRYINQRDSYISYWADGKAVNNSGSTILFYNIGDQGKYDTALKSANAVVAQYKDRVGQVFSVPQSVIDTYESSLPSSDNITDYVAAKTQVEIALSTFKTNVDEQWVRPTEGKVYIVKNAHNNRYLYAPNTLGSQLNTVTNSTQLPQFAWTFELGTTDGTYKIKNIATNTYVAHPNEFITSTEATDLTITKSNLYDAAGAIGLTGGNYFMHSNQTTPVINGGDTWGASRWYIQEANYQDISTSIDNTFGIFPNVKDDTYNSAKSAFEADKTADKLNAWFNTAIRNTECKNYRIQNGRGTYNVLSFNSNGATILNESELKSAVNDLWRFKWENFNKFRLYNLNADKYLAAPANYDTENTTALTDIAQSETFYVAEYTEAKYFTITTTDGKKINGESNNKGCRVNNWSVIDGGKSNIWHILEASDIEVDMHAAGDGKTYATVYLPVSISGATNAKTFVAEAPSETSVTMNETTTGVEALNGFLIIGDESTTTAILTIGESNMTSQMTGTLTTLDISTEDKSLYNVFARKIENDQTTTTVGFFTPSETLNSIGGNRGFFKGTKAQALVMDFGGQVTGIKRISNVIGDSLTIYDLCGRRVKHVTSGGLYITNGHKFIAK